MNPQNRDDEALRRKEQELQERERALRLREMEAELYQQAPPNEPPLSPTTKHQASGNQLSQKYRKLLNVAQFLGIVVAVVIAVRIASWLATAVMIGGVAWVVYKMFFEADRRKP